MKLLLTSAGLTNKSIVNALLLLNGKPFEETSMAFIPTAANVEPGDKDWLIDDMMNCKNLGLASKIKEPIYAIDDNSAIQVIDNKIQIISEGTWMSFNM